MKRILLDTSAYSACMKGQIDLICLIDYVAYFTVILTLDSDFTRVPQVVTRLLS